MTCWNHTPTCSCEKCTPRSLAEKFWPKVEKAEPDGCWEWKANRDRGGYGRMTVAGTPRKIDSAHRVAWQLTNGPIPDGLWVLHRCDNRGCVNPAHLFLGTRTDNVRDMMAKGRDNIVRAKALAARTHCRKGHEYTLANTGRNTDGSRRCRACDRISHRPADHPLLASSNKLRTYPTVRRAPGTGPRFRRASSEMHLR